jgi:hypothetical protein
MLYAVSIKEQNRGCAGQDQRCTTNHVCRKSGSTWKATDASRGTQTPSGRLPSAGNDRRGEGWCAGFRVPGSLHA